MKAESPVGSAEGKAAVTDEGAVALLGLPATLVIGGVGEFVVCVVSLRLDGSDLVEGDAKGLAGGEVLQDVHIVGDDRLPGIFLGQVGVPACPGRLSAGQEGIVAVKGYHVCFVGEGFQQGNLFRGRRIDEAQRLVGMAGEDDLVEGLAGPVGEGKLNPFPSPDDLLNG